MTRKEKLTNVKEIGTAECSEYCAGDGRSNPVSTTDVLPQPTVAGDDAMTKEHDAKNTEHTTGDKHNRSAEPCCVNEAFTYTEAIHLSQLHTEAPTKDAADTGSTEQQVSAIDVAYPSTANIIALDESESKPSCFSRCCIKPLRSLIGLKKNKTDPKKTDSFWPMLRNPVVLLYATSAGVSNRLVN